MLMRLVAGQSSLLDSVFNDMAAKLVLSPPQRQQQQQQQQSPGKAVSTNWFATASPSSSPLAVSGSSSLSFTWDQFIVADTKSSVLGEGSFGIILKVIWNRSALAVKVIIPKSGPNFDKDYDNLRESVVNEVRMLQEFESKLPFGCDHIVKVFGLFEGELSPSFNPEFGMKKALGIAMHLEAGDTLANYLRVSRGLLMIDRLHVVLQPCKSCTRSLLSTET